VYSELLTLGCSSATPESLAVLSKVIVELEGTYLIHSSVSACSEIRE
jgi:hypothetical protein